MLPIRIRMVIKFFHYLILNKNVSFIPPLPYLLALICQIYLAKTFLSIDTAAAIYFSPESQWYVPR